MKNKLEVIEWLLAKEFDECSDDRSLVISICQLMRDAQTTFTEREMQGIYICGIRYGNDWRKELAKYEEMMKQLNN
jgi:hypothetical protein